MSTESEEQESSYKFQVEYYTQHIKKHPDWQLADIYADEYTPYGLNPKSP
ncbi:MAG: hypothetical protein PHV32_09545 [Eubacteriales bacterium]|nr:hypothetical protein [Eubacteriales bacterium]